MGKVETLITEVRKRPELWSSKNALYKSRAERSIVLGEISKKLNIDPATVRKKWKNLKEHYRRELKRLDRSDQPCQSSWVFFESMDFLREEVTKCASSTWEAPKSDDEMHDETPAPQEEEPPKKNRLVDEVRDEIVQMEKKKLSLIEKQLEKQDDLKDEDYLYMMSVLPYMRRLGLVQKLRFRGKINQWLLDTVACDESKDDAS